MTPSRDITRLIEIMAALRTPVTGCPWDLEQSFETIAPYTLEEAYEVADAIAKNDLVELREELGDVKLVSCGGDDPITTGPVGLAQGDGLVLGGGVEHLIAGETQAGRR